jgi:hypothetical protein
MTPVLRLAAICLASLLTACGVQEDLNQPPEPLGDFRLGYTIVVADNAKTAGPSRQATPEQWETALKTEVIKRVGRYQGEKLYHLGIGVNAYALAVPGVPIVISPKSVVVVTVDVWDDTQQRVINAEPKQFTIFEGMSGETVIGSGLTKSGDEQLQTLSENAARTIADWLVENKAWFTPEAVAARALLPAPAPAAGQPAPPDAAPPAN